ncbi:poly-beta-1,6-N-acetyl-D-glucosamine biosynthesis protein PgaD [Acinetobacter sp. YH01022]|uniref:poly-beta-1,6-N-acetyl-D-glucosamine biosynthesis protein PgaD n=1 Tax=Acinetobacter sp. YH01022 TaxID=2601036 RepID=UPI0015D379F4|nr:poly-beta-1,6-N-acetyl-D-glucosamine biosynthesis protein PgaD [Acinetobacter sp. YH01022]
MKNNPLIIDLHHCLPWHKRYASHTSTAMMWAVWLLLWRPLLIVLGIVSLQKQHVLHQLFSAFGLGIEHGVSALLACAVGLLLWANFVPAKTVKTSSAKNIADYGQHFGLAVEEIEQGRQQKVSVVHHDEHGKIIHIE